VFELIEYPMEYQRFNIRIYENKKLMSKIDSHIIYMQIKGQYITQLGTIVNDSDFSNVQTTDELNEKLQSIDVFYGTNANFILIQFAKRILDNYKKVH
jgi:hypothetical protein